MKTGWIDDLCERKRRRGKKRRNKREKSQTGERVRGGATEGDWRFHWMGMGDEEPEDEKM